MVMLLLPVPSHAIDDEHSADVEWQNMRTLEAQFHPGYDFPHTVLLTSMIPRCSGFCPRFVFCLLVLSILTLTAVTPTPHTDLLLPGNLDYDSSDDEDDTMTMTPTQPTDLLLQILPTTASIDEDDDDDTDSFGVRGGMGIIIIFPVPECAAVFSLSPLIRLSSLRPSRSSNWTVP
jgi:hypothetical protein